MQKEQWSTHSFNNICWKRNETALKRISKALQAKTAKMCHNSRNTSACHELWYGKAKPCCMCGHREDWRHVLTCKSLDAELLRAYSWSKLKKKNGQMESAIWHVDHHGEWRTGLYTEPAKERYCQHASGSTLAISNYFSHTNKQVEGRIPRTIKNRRDNFLKGRLSWDWITSMEHHFQTNGNTLTWHECITRLILWLWEHMDHIWKYCNNIYHDNTNQQVTR
jgi:hypothetical protein